MKKTFILGLCMGFLVVSSGCATVGSPFKFQGTQSITNGVTTKSEVLALYGKPFRVGYEDGHEKWTYGYYKYRLIGDSETKDLAVTFDGKGVVKSYTYSTTDTEEKS